jgi:hypothetical protein
MPKTAEKLASQARLWLILSLASSVVCATGCFGLLGGLWSVLALQKAQAGELPTAAAYLRTAKISVGVGILVLVIAVLSYLVARFVLHVG